MRLARKRCVWVPTWQGGLALLALLSALAFLLVSEIYSFLAETERKEAEMLVVEGWVPDYALEAALAEFRRWGYRYLCTTGGPLDHGSHLTSFDNWAALAGAGLRTLGARGETLIEAPAPAVRRNRTYHSAKALRQRLAAEGLEPGKLNVLTLGAHARRTRLVYEKVFGSKVEVGIISVPSRDYDPDRWWISSSGIKEVLIETIGWFAERVANTTIEEDREMPSE